MTTRERGPGADTRRPLKRQARALPHSVVIPAKRSASREPPAAPSPEVTDRPSPRPIARMRRPVHVEEPGGVDRGVALGRRQRGVAEQFLDRLQVAAAGQQVGGEGMPERVRRGGLRQAEPAAQRLDGLLDAAGTEPAALGADEQRVVRPEPVGQRSRYSASARRTTGSTGTIRALPPLPTTVSVSPTGRTRRSRPTASPTRSPQPYSRVSMAASRAAIHGSSDNSPTLSRASRASPTVRAFGTDCGTRGPRTAATAALAARPRRSRKRKKPRTVDRARAVELLPSPSSARRASQARKSAGERAARAARPTVSP